MTTSTDSRPNVHSALYYPRIAFADSAWAKAMALHYDRVYRIVPAGVRYTDHRDLESLVEAGVLGTPLDPAPFASQAAAAFVDGLTRWDAFELESADDARRELVPVHEGKVDRVLRDLFDEMGFDRHAGWMHVPAQVAHDYMMFLATEIAKANRVSLVTDGMSPWVATTYFLHDGRLPAWPGSTAEPESEACVLMSLLLKQFVPRNIEEISGDKILEFRRSRADELIALRRALGAMASELESLDHGEVAGDLLEMHVASVERALEDYRRSADVINAKAWFGVTMMGVPTPLSVANALQLSGPTSLIMAGTCLALGGIYALGCQRAEMRKLRTSAPFSALALMQDDFADGEGGTTLNNRAHGRLHEFIND